MSTRFRYRFPAALLAFCLLGCAERHRSGTIAFRLASGRGAAIAALGRDSIMVRRAELVLQEIQLAPAGTGEWHPEEEEAAWAPPEMGPVLRPTPVAAAP